MEETELNEQTTIPTNAPPAPPLNNVAPHNGNGGTAHDAAVHPATCNSCGAQANGNGTPAAPSYVLAIGRVEMRFPSLGVEKEFAQATGRADTKGLTDRAAAKAQEAPLDEARGLLKSLRLQGLEEDAVRLFVCKFSGPYWELLYEALFGYEAMLAARASRKGDTGETWKKFGTWREPIVQWADAKMEARRLAKSC